MILPKLVSLEETVAPLEWAEIAKPKPGHGEVLVRVLACGVCHTELDEIEGRTAPPKLPIVLGHEVVGRVDRLGTGAVRLKEGDRVGVGWIHSSTGRADENLSPEFRATGRDVNGGYAEYMTVPEKYAYAIPEIFPNEKAAPLLCAGAIGYRSLQLAGIKNGENLGLTGFGGSAHLVLQLSHHLFPKTKVFVFARDENSRDFARKLGADWTGDTSDRAPELLHAVIDTTPAWRPVVEALANLRPGGRLVINAIRKDDADQHYLSNLRYQDHLWMEKEIKSVANITHRDIRKFLSVAAKIPIEPEVETYAFRDANRALSELKHLNVKGSKVLIMD